MKCEFLNKEEKMSTMQPLDAEKVLLEIWNLLRDINITFFLRHGTCLGAVRDGKLISWDDDIDIGSIIGMHNLNESSIDRAIKKFADSNFEVKVSKTDFHIGVELSKYNIPIDWSCYRVHEESILQYPGVKIPTHLYEELRSVPLLGKSFYVPNPPEEYLTLKYGPNWRIPKRKGFEADIIDSIPESINLSKSSFLTRVSKFLFPKKYLTRIQILSSDLQPLPNVEVTIVGFSKQVTDHNGNIMFKIADKGDYALDIGSGEAREILYEEILEPGKEYTYVQDIIEKQGRLHVLHEKT